MVLVLVLALLVVVKAWSRDMLHSVAHAYYCWFYNKDKGKPSSCSILPVVCSVGEFPNDYFHRTKSLASENTNTTEMCVSAKRLEPQYRGWVLSKVRHKYLSVTHLTVMLTSSLNFFLNSCGIWTAELQIPRLSSHSSMAPVLEWFRQEHRVHSIKEKWFIF